MPLILGTVAFSGWELPETMPFGGSQRLAKHRMIGGKKVLDALGPDDVPLTWSGRFKGPLARLRERQLDTMRRAGKSHVLTYSTFAYRVTIERFVTNALNDFDIPFTITCEVIEDLIAGGVGDLLNSLEDAVTGGLADALGLAKDSPIVTGAITAAQSAVNSVATTGSLNLSTLSGSAMAGVQGGFASSIAQAGGIAQAASRTLGSSPLSSVLSGPVSSMGAGVSSIVQAGELAWKASGVQSLLTRAAANVIRA